jgi:hypothetical protein
VKVKVEPLGIEIKRSRFVLSAHMTTKERHENARDEIAFIF